MIMTSGYNIMKNEKLKIHETFFIKTINRLP